MRLVFMGTADFAVPSLEALVRGPHYLAGVITQPDRPGGRGQRLQPSPVKLAAGSLGLELSQPQSIKGESFRSYIETQRPDALVVVAYGKLIPGWLIETPSHGVVNLHGSLLPKYRGAAPVNWAIANRESVTGVCTMRIDEGLDTGPVYACRTVEIGARETAPELSERLSHIGASLLVETLSAIEKGEASPTVQPDEGATLAPRLRREDGYVRFDCSAEEIDARVRAFLPWPSVVVSFREKRCRLLETRVAESAHDGLSQGEIAVNRGRLLVRCAGRPLLEVRRLQMENRKASSGSDFLNGFQLRPGEGFEPFLQP